MSLSKLPWSKSSRAKVDNNIIGLIQNQLASDQVFVDTSWLDIADLKQLDLDNTKTAICYSGIDWENTTCTESRIEAHKYISNHSKKQLHIGNSNGQFYFSWWAEFVRQYPDYFFHESYTQNPDCHSLFMCLNRKPHGHRVFLLELLYQYRLDKVGIISSADKLLNDNIFFHDNHDLEARTSPNDILTLGDPALWGHHFINVVTETTIHTDVFLSEKTWKPIIGLRPFLILGDHGIYAKLQELGFDTFDDIFGQWYLNPEWQHRAESIVDILNKFDKDSSVLNSLWTKLKPRLQANRQRMIDFQIENFNKICNLNLQ